MERAGSVGSSLWIIKGNYVYFLLRLKNYLPILTDVISHGLHKSTVSSNYRDLIQLYQEIIVTLVVTSRKCDIHSEAIVFVIECEIF